MCKPWNKMTKDEKLACANYNIKRGFAVFLFGLIWMYFTSVVFDVWKAFQFTLVIMGLLLLLLGLVKRSSV